MWYTHDYKYSMHALCSCPCLMLCKCVEITYHRKAQNSWQYIHYYIIHVYREVYLCLHIHKHSFFTSTHIYVLLLICIVMLLISWLHSSQQTHLPALCYIIPSSNTRHYQSREPEEESKAYCWGYQDHQMLALLSSTASGKSLESITTLMQDPLTTWSSLPHVSWHRDAKNLSR